MAKAPDALAIEQLIEAYRSSNCNGFFACPGGDHVTRIIPMVTCHGCAARILLRRALKRMGITDDPENYKHPWET